MKTTYHHNARRVWLAMAAGLVVGGMYAATLRAENMYRPPSGPTAGGVPAQSIVTLNSPTSTNATLCWYGMQGWYNIEMTTNAGVNWDNVGSVETSAHSVCATVTHNGGASASFRLNQNNNFAGSKECSSCHGDKYSEWLHTAHASAYTGITNETAQAAEIVYRSVGYGQPTGFTNLASTPKLANVGCETCHGPAGWHRFSDHNIIHPAVSIDPQICGGCHSTTDRPTYTEYLNAGHATVLGDISLGSATPGVYYTNTVAQQGTNFVAVGTAGSSNLVYGYLVTTNADLSLKTNLLSGILHSGNGPGAGNAQYEAGVNPGWSRALSCGICHSAASRKQMVDDYDERLAGRTNVLVGAADVDAASWAAACVTCHDPHSDKYPSQMRYPLWSTNYFTQPTTTDLRTTYANRLTNGWNLVVGGATNMYYMNTPFAANYNPDVQVCGQCHNSRGARWDGLPFGFITNNVAGWTTNRVYTDIYTNIYTTNAYGIVTNSWIIGRTLTTNATYMTNRVVTLGVLTNGTKSFSRPPHHSPQYNILSGIIQPDYLGGTNILGCHSLNTNGCAACHVHPEESPTITTGHTFEPEMANCSVSGCHDGITTNASGNVIIDAAIGKAALQSEISNGIVNAVGMLQTWAITKGSTVLGGNAYGPNGWEYTAPGSLSPTNFVGPDSTGQLKLPTDILQARFNLYLLAYGQSSGIHNPTLSRFLVADASNKVVHAMGGSMTITNPPTAYVTVSATSVLTNTAITIRNASTNATSFSWTVEDPGNTQTNTSTLAALPAVTYANAGTNSLKVMLTASSGVGSATYSNTFTIKVYNAPFAAFAMDTTNGVAPLTVNFTNQSANYSYTTNQWIFYRCNSTNTPFYTNNTSSPSSYTFTNGYYIITLKSGNPAAASTATGYIRVQ